MRGDIILEAKGLVKRYGQGTGSTLAVDGIDLTLREGELLVILGSSGSGKSTLLNLIGGMDNPTEGSILVDGTDIAKAPDNVLTRYRRDTVGFVFQAFNLIPELTARENIALIAEGGDPEEYLKAVGLEGKGDHYPSQLSGGEQQRVSIARALAKKSRFLLSDEPTGALDYETGKQILQELEKIARERGKTVVIVTHTQEIGRMADRVIRVRNGRITEEYENASPISAVDVEW